MSAIFGVLGPIEASSIGEMARRLSHRGAHTDMQEVAPNVRMGCLSGSPATGLSRSGQSCAVSDSWLYDPAQATAEEDETGLNTGTATLLSAYAQTGLDGLNKVGGQFSISIWDDSSKQLILARDYTGTLPLYYAQPESGGLVFASEYKAILALERVPAEADLDMVQRLQHYKHLPSDKTLLKDVRSLPPGTVLIFDVAGQLQSRSRFPVLRLNVRTVPLEQSVELVAQSFLKATRIRLAGLKSIGVALSGGIDSIGVAYACRQANPDAELHTFTAGHGPDDPEVKTASFVAEKIGSIHHNIFVTPDDLAANIPAVVWHMENPIARTEALQFYKLGQEAGKYVDNLFTGAAADGLFAGMPKHKILWLMHLLPMLRYPLGEFYNLTQSGRKPDSLLGKLLDRLYFKSTVPEVPHVSGSHFSPDTLQFPPNSREFVNEVLCGVFQEGVSQWLPKVERTLRAGGVNYTSPFLDRSVIDVAFSVPSAHKIHRGKEKHVLRQALRSLVPPEVLRIPKFPMKMKHDTAFSDSIDAIADLVLGKESVEQRGFFDFEELRRLRRRKAGEPYSSEGAMRIWTAVLTEVWAQEFLTLRGEKPVPLDSWSI